MSLHLRTPLLRSDALGRALGGGANVWLKMDSLQPPGSFKLRGVGNLVRNAIAGGATHVVSSSGGNAGLATAYAGRELGVPVTVVLPETTPAFVVGRLREYGADAVVHGKVWDEANARALELVEDLGGAGALVHPFDHPDLWEGHATLVHEVREQLEAQTGHARAPAAVVTVVGGGGLLRGILQGLDDVADVWGNSVPVIACETRGAASMASSLEAGHLVTLPGIDSVAKSLGAATVSKEIFEHCVALGPDRVQPWVTSDEAAVRACARFAEDHRTLVEPACGAGLAAVYEHAAEGAGAPLAGLLGAGAEGGGDSGNAADVVVVVCGGAMATPASLRGWCDDLGIEV